MSNELCLANTFQVCVSTPTTDTTLKSVPEPDSKVTQKDNDNEQTDEADKVKPSVQATQESIDTLTMDVELLSVVCGSSDEDSFADAVERAIEEEIKPSIPMIKAQKVTERLNSEAKDSIKQKKKYKKHSYKKKKAKQAEAKKAHFSEGDTEPVVGRIAVDVGTNTQPDLAVMEKENETPKRLKSKHRRKPVEVAEANKTGETQPQQLQFRKKSHYRHRNDGTQYRGMWQKSHPNTQYISLAHTQNRFSGPPKIPGGRLVNHYDSWGYFTPLEPSANFYGSNPFQKPRRKKSSTSRKETSPTEKKASMEEMPKEVSTMETLVV